MRFGSALVVVCLAAAVAACGGGGGTAGAPPPPPPPPPPSLGTLVVDVVDIDDRPIGAASVCANGPGDGFCRVTDASGHVELPNLRVGEWSVGAGHPDHFAASRRVTVVDKETRAVRIVLTPGNRYAVVMLDSHGRLSADRRQLDFDLDFAMLDRDGTALSTLTATDTKLLELDCAFWLCGGGLGGGLLPLGTPTLALRPAGVRSSYDALLLLDTGTTDTTFTFDAPELAPGIARFLAAGSTTDRVTVAAPQNGADGCRLRVITMVPSNDGTGSLSLPAGAVDGCRIALHELVASALPLVAGAATRRAIVVLTPRGDFANDPATLDEAAARGVELWIVSTGGGAWPALRTHGGYAQFQASRAQLRPLFAALDALLSGSLSTYRLTGAYGTSGETFAAGAISAAMDVRLPTGATLTVQDFAVPVPANP